MVDAPRENTDRDLLLDAIVQRLNARRPTAALGECIAQIMRTLRSMEHSQDHPDPEFLREVATASAAKILAFQRRPSRLERLRREWDTLTGLVGAIFKMAPPPPKRDEYIVRALRQLAEEWLGLVARPSLIRQVRAGTRDNPQGIALQLLWQGHVNPDQYQEPESLRRALNRVSPETPWGAVAVTDSWDGLHCVVCGETDHRWCNDTPKAH